MIDRNTIPAESPLIGDELKGQLAQILAKMKEPMTVKAIVPTDTDKGAEMAAFLNVFCGLGDKISLELYEAGEAEAVPELNAAYLPVTGLYKDGEFKRVSFHGVPGGKEINPFVAAMINLSGAGTGVGFLLKKKIEKISKPANLKICVSLACHHCPNVVAACQQIALLNPMVEAEMIDARLYEDLVARYKIERVPCLIVNDQDIYMGEKTIDEISDLLKS